MSESLFTLGWTNLRGVTSGNAILTDEDRDNIHAFNLRMTSNMSRTTFNQMRHTFRNKISIGSEWTIINRMAILSQIEPEWYDCCINSCITYTRQHCDSDICPYCHEPRFSSAKKPRRRFPYIPLIPRLQGFFKSPAMIETLSYRHRYVRTPGTINDIFDCDHYCKLQETYVSIDGKRLNHRFFSGEHDIALSFCLDGYLLYKRRRGGPSATPLLVQIYNLPPEIRTHLCRLLCLGVIPGPHSPKDVYTFLAPFDDECAKLAHGVHTYNPITNQIFPLRAYCILGHGDIIAIEQMLSIKGHNGYSPCRSCEITGVRNVTGHETVYYVPLTQPHDTVTPGMEPHVWDPRHLPLRSHASFANTVDLIASARTKTTAAKIAKCTGIKALPALRRVSSLHYGRSFPWEWAHIICENLIPNLVSLWMGRFKKLDEGTESYVIAPHIWELIGQETEDAVKHIPSAFVRVLGNLAKDRSTFTAEAWCFWFMYLAPILLEGRFRKTKYYKHLLDLVQIMKICLQFSITHAEIDDLENRIIKWVAQYEKYVELL